MSYGLDKADKLKGKKLIEELFLNGSSITVFPLRLIYLKKEHLDARPVKCGFSVAKRKFKLAVDRNRIKRQMRESYRKNQHSLLQNIPHNHIIMITYIDEKAPISVELEEKMILLLIKFMKKVKE